MANSSQVQVQPATRSLRVALLVETSLESGRDILRGIARYCGERSQWAIFHEPRSLEDGPPDWLDGWTGDGIIARLQNRRLLDAVRASGIPCVDVLGAVEDSGCPLVHVDNRLLAELAAEHLVDCGYRTFAFCGMPGQNWSRQRCQWFSAFLSDRGQVVSTYDHHAQERGAESTWEQAQDRLADWLGGLKKPVGVMVCSDQIGTDVMEACQRCGVHVPDEAGIIGVDDDEPLCMVCNPPMSSINAGHRQVGYRAAMELDGMMHGAVGQKESVAIPPVGITARRSTDALALDDPNLVRAVRFVRDHACHGICVDDVAAEAMLSRSVLQRRFKSQIGRTVHEEILRGRLHKAEELLRITEVPIADIAVIAGFRHQEYLGVVFKRRFGKSPAAYRRSTRLEAGGRSSPLP